MVLAGDVTGEVEGADVAVRKVLGPDGLQDETFSPDVKRLVNTADDIRPQSSYTSAPR